MQRWTDGVDMRGKSQISHLNTFVIKLKHLIINLKVRINTDMQEKAKARLRESRLLAVIEIVIERERRPRARTGRKICIVPLATCFIKLKHSVINLSTNYHV